MKRHFLLDVKYEYMYVCIRESERERKKNIRYVYYHNYLESCHLGHNNRNSITTIVTQSYL